MSDSLSPHGLQHFLWTCMDMQASLSFTISWSLLKLLSIESVILTNHFILCHSLSLLVLNLFQHQGLFQWAGCSHQVAKVLQLQLQHEPSSLNKMIWNKTSYISDTLYLLLILYLPSVVVQKRALEPDPAPLLIWSPHPQAELSWKLLSHAWLFATPWTVAHQDPLSME